MGHYCTDRRCRDRIFQKLGESESWFGEDFRLMECLKYACYIESKLNAEMYCKILEKHLVPFAYAYRGTGLHDFVFMQDGTKALTSNLAKQWSEDSKVSTLRWPACFQDLNPIEKVWGYLTRRVYSNSTQAENKEELHSSISDAWNTIPHKGIQSLNVSMPCRCIKVLTDSRRAINY